MCAASGGTSTLLSTDRLTVTTSAAAPSAPSAAKRSARRWLAIRETGLVLLCQILLLAAFLGAWEWISAQSKQSAFLFGSPSAIFGFLVQMWKDGSLFRD